MAKPPKLTLIFPRDIWETITVKELGYDFTKIELDAAEKKEVKLIGEKNGVLCYIPNKFE